MLIENEPHWFPMRIRNSSLSRLEQMVEHFDKEKKHLGQSVLLETYVPLNFIKVSMTKMDFAPYLLNYIFVHSTFKDLVEIKHSREDFEPLRFVMHPAYDEKYERHNEVLTMSDKMMSDYMRITAEENDKIVFPGVVGRIKRIGGARCVVLPIGKEMAPAIIDIPNSHLRYLSDMEINKIKEEDKKNYCCPIKIGID